MEIIHCFNFVMVFFCLVVSAATLAYAVQTSMYLVKMMDWLKKQFEELDDEENYPEPEKPKEPQLPIDNYAVVKYDDDE